MKYTWGLFLLFPDQADIHPSYKIMQDSKNFQKTFKYFQKMGKNFQKTPEKPKNFT